MSNPKDASNLYQWLYDDHHIENVTTSSSNRTTILDMEHPFFELSSIELFVEIINQSKSLAFDEEKLLEGKLKIQNKALERHYSNINWYFEAYSDSFIYSPKVNEFYAACKNIAHTPFLLCFGRPLEQALPDGKTTYAHLFNHLIVLIRKACSASSFTRKNQRHQRNSYRRQAKALMWEKEMFQWRSRHLILSLTLGYKEQYRSAITLEVLQEHLKRFLNNKRNNQLLQRISGYVWKIEDGLKTGLHVHILIAYSTEAQRDIFIAEEIGKYWESTITDGRGQYHNSNKSKGWFQLHGHGVGVGQINHYDDEKREALRKNLAYLTKSDQYLKQKRCAKTRVFAMSRIPERSGAGRPRMHAMSSLNKDSPYEIIIPS